MTADKTAAPDLGTPITMTYRNYRGEVDQRTVVPSRIWFGSTDWHPEPGWLMSAYDLGKAAHSDFALADCQFTDLCASGQVRALAFIEAARFIEEMEQVDPPEPMTADMLKAVAGAGLREMAKRLAALTPAPQTLTADQWRNSPARFAAHGITAAPSAATPTAQEAVATDGELDEAWKSGFNAGFGEAKLTAQPPQPSETVAELVGWWERQLEDVQNYPAPLFAEKIKQTVAALRALKGEA